MSEDFLKVFESSALNFRFHLLDLFLSHWILFPKELLILKRNISKQMSSRFKTEWVKTFQVFESSSLNFCFNLLDLFLSHWILFFFWLKQKSFLNECKPLGFWEFKCFVSIIRCKRQTMNLLFWPLKVF